MNSHPTFLTVLFVDICKSTAIYEKYGNEKAHGLIATTLALMQEEVESRGGRVIKTIGDEIMACFWHPLYALDTAKGINLRLSSALPAPGLPQVAVHAAFEYGQVVEEEGDSFGDAVNVAARLTGLAKPGQILTTSQTVASLGSENSETTRQVTRTTVRGRLEPVEVHEVVWEDAGLTRFDQRPLEEKPIGRLRLRLGGQGLEVDSQHPVGTLGRGQHCDLVVPDRRVSRLHALVELRRGRFYLVDKSTNGTYIMAEGRRLAFLNYDEYLLPARGSLLLGRDVDPGQQVTIHFELCP